MKNIFIRKKNRYGLTFTGRLTVLLLIIGCGILYLLSIHSFLKVNRPCFSSKFLIVDGLMPNTAYDTIFSRYRKGSYDFLITTGVNIDYSYISSEEKNAAILSYQILKTKGIRKGNLVAIPAKNIERDRTFACAAELKKWFHSNNIQPESIDIVSFGVHSRRSWLLYRKVFENETKVGIIAVSDPSYKEKKWWRYSRGVRMVITETIGYVYSYLFI